jgi:hypothetical protein
MKFSKVVTHAIIIALLLAILYQLMTPRSSYSMMTPGDLSIKGTGKEPSAFGDLRPSLSCVPGPEQNSSYYTMGLTPGGVCGDMNFVSSQMKDYSIADGIGGSLLDKT